VLMLRGGQIMTHYRYLVCLFGSVGGDLRYRQPSGLRQPGNGLGEPLFRGTGSIVTYHSDPLKRPVHDNTAGKMR
jgi:hypothetical protein